MHQILKLKCLASWLAVVFAQYIETKCYVENEDVVGAASTGDAPTTSELSTIWLPTEVRLILETGWYLKTYFENNFFDMWVPIRIKGVNSRSYEVHICESQMNCSG